MKGELKNLKPETRQAFLEKISEVLYVDDVVALLDTTSNGRVRSSLANAVKILSFDPLLRDGFKYNEFSGRVEVVKNMGWTRNSSAAGFTDDDLHCVHLYFEENYGIGSLPMIDEAVHLVANRYSFHPIRDYLKGLEWDGQERIRYALHHFLGADTSDYTFEGLRAFMLGAITRAYKPGAKFDNLIVLVGDQGAGKSSFFRLLAVQDEWFCDDLRDLESSAVYEKLQGHWIIELSEMLATANAKSTESIKSFLSRQTDAYREPYARYTKDRPRQAVFAGTTNKTFFLPNDRSGNRRFIPIACSSEEAEVFILDNEEQSRAYIDQMWAEAMHYYRAGTSLKLSKEFEAEARRRQTQFLPEDTNEDAILGYMQDYKGAKVCSKQLFYEALRNSDLVQPAKWQLNEINEIMTKLIKEDRLAGWQRFDSPQRFGPYGTQRGWECQQGVNKEVSTTAGFLPVEDGEDIGF